MADIVRSVWPEWEIEEKIGEGSSAVVYRVKRSTEEVVLHAAVKVITLPNSLEWGVLGDDLAHLRLDGGEVVAREAVLHVEVVVEAFGGRGADVELGVGVKAADRGRHYVRRAVADGLYWKHFNLYLPAFRGRLADRHFSDNETQAI